MPEFDSINEALVACVKACGGSKVLGPKLWPEKAPEAAQRLLLDCLNDDRPAHLTPEQTLLVLREARSHGFHEGMHFLASTLGYSEPTPVDPRDELADLLRVSIEERRQQAKRDERIERLLEAQTGRNAIRSVA